MGHERGEYVRSSGTGGPMGLKGMNPMPDIGVDDGKAAARRLRGAMWFGAGASIAVVTALAFFILPGRPVPAASADVASRAGAISADTIVEERVRRLEGQVARLDELARRGTQADPAALPRADRFLIALLHLENVVATSRPWQRDLQLVLELASGDQIARPLVEVLGSHAARGLPTEAELRERFMGLSLSIAARTPREGGILQRALGSMRATFADIGLMAPPVPGATEAALLSVAERLRRGDLAGAVTEVTMLGEDHQPLLAGWLSQARARLAVEHAIRETMLRALSPGMRP